MGETRAPFKVYGPNGKVVELEALVDTGATFTKLPGPVAGELELKARYETEVELADGRRVRRGLALAEVEIEGVKRPVLIAAGGEKEKPLIGYTTLEILGFKVNPITGRLERTIAIEYKGSRIAER
ncbi:MAG: aspartyl protease family protein [Candidatus Acetothermia bacterium]|jgi:clan AA aspartic protease|nr:aspartyl protease family protein [Candidatus Acetothermia bacterium]MDH7504804.1 aspartyl protease family protein [Candidatus Acetothermia bacterium]